MTTKAFVIFGVLLTCVFSGCDQSQAASIKTSPQTITPRADEADTGKEPAAKTMQEFDSDAISSEPSPSLTAAETRSAPQVSSGVVYLHETFDSYETEAVLQIPGLQRADPLAATALPANTNIGKQK